MFKPFPSPAQVDLEFHRPAPGRVKRTLQLDSVMSANDPKRTSGVAAFRKQ